MNSQNQLLLNSRLFLTEFNNREIKDVYKMGREHNPSGMLK